MTFKNISEKAVLNAAGRLIDPGVQVTMTVEYYAGQKDFVDGYVTRKLAKIGGIEEYEDFLKNGPKKPEPKVDLMEEVRQEEAAKEAKKKAEPKVEEVKAEEAPVVETPAPVEEAKVEETPVVEKAEEAPVVKEAPVKKTTRRRAKKAPAAKAE